MKYLENKYNDIRFRLGNSGASAVEFAMISPVLLFILAAIIGYGLLFSTSISVHQLGADVTRATIGGLTLEEKQMLAKQHLESAATDYFLIEPKNVTVVLSYDDVEERTIVDVTYTPENHPIRVFEGFLPIPEKSFSVRQSISEHRKAG